MCHAFQAAAILVSLSVAKVIFQVNRLPKYLPFVSNLTPKSPWRAACPSAACVDFDPPPRATTTFSSSFRFCVVPIAVNALSNWSFSSAASARIVNTSSGRCSLHPGGRLHLFLDAAFWVSLSSSSGGHPSGSCPSVLSSWYGSPSSGRGLSSGSFPRLWCLDLTPTQGPLRLPCLHASHSTVAA